MACTTCPASRSGKFAIRPGPLMAAADRFDIVIEGKGGHAARPHECVDTLLVACQVVNALQSIAARNVDPLESVVVSVCALAAGEAYNVIPQTARLKGTTRTLTEAVRDLAETRIRAITEATCAAYGAKASVDYRRGYPVTVNHPEQTDFIAKVAAEVGAGERAVDTTIVPLMGVRGLLLHAREPPRRLHLHGQRRHRRASTTRNTTSTTRRSPTASRSGRR